MGKLTGFMEYRRKPVPYRDAAERSQDFEELYTQPTEEHLRLQAARCMDCGVPFCQSDSGCPVDNLIPEWNDLVYQGRWKEALERLLKTNNFPDFTGRVCPAPCESACVLGITDPPVTIKNIEMAIIERGFAEGWIKPKTPSHHTGQRVAIIGSGPAGLAAAEQLIGVGHEVTVFERADRIGGLLMYGIPNMKLGKDIVDRRVDLIREAGVKFVTGADIGRNVDAAKLRGDFDVILLATGATRPRDLQIPGRELGGIHFAMDYLTASAKNLLDDKLSKASPIDAKGKRVIVIGGGDTGADCVGTALRQGCQSVVNLELLDQPPAERAPHNPWPQWPKIMRTEYAHGEAIVRFGADPRSFAMLTRQFLDDGNGRVRALETARVRWEMQGARPHPVEMENGAQHLEADLVLLAMGFTGPESYLGEAFDITQDARSNYAAEHGVFTTNVPGVFAAGDCRRGQSLIVWAINEGRGAARAVDLFLRGTSHLPAPGVTLGTSTD